MNNFEECLKEQLISEIAAHVANIKFDSHQRRYHVFLTTPASLAVINGEQESTAETPVGLCKAGLTRCLRLSNL
ncbi:unnamed protein product [Larinioides sclopetarius]|uniref:Uncharacterized protein n=1 Tax=Larinioides sclopetarius TaxID=280406 RepID=A0AAV1YZG2_9ARAC